jgi:outer membrane receptor for monomeric catechols
LYWTPADWLAVSTEYRYVREDSSPGPEVTTHSVPVELRFFHPSGIFAGARATFVDQSGRFEINDNLRSDSDQFWVADAALGYRLPNRWGLTALEVSNLFDRHFHFQDVDPSSPTILPERTILGRLILRF